MIKKNFKKWEKLQAIYNMVIFNLSRQTKDKYLPKSNPTLIDHQRYFLCLLW